MNIVAINKSTNSIFESQSCQNDLEKDVIENCIKKDAQIAGIDIEIRHMTDDELETFIA